MKNSLQKQPHPNRSILKDFAVGRLGQDIRPEIEAHIQSCDRCCRELDAMGDDTLINRLKDLDTHTDLSEKVSGDLEEIPDELAGHSRYEIVERIGSGGMGDVFRARHRLMDRMVAIKVIKPSLVDNTVAVSRFQNEIKAAARLSHRNIVASHDAEQIGETQLLVMEYIDGKKLSEYVAPEKPLSIRRACFFARQLAIGLEYAHQQRMIHRDIKPHNVLVTSDGVVKFLDFGLAKFAREVSEEKQDAALTADGECFGTPDYIAPEQIRSSKLSDIRADIYSLGCTLRFMLTGYPPFPTGSITSKLAAHLEQMPVPISEFRNDVPHELADLLNRLMAKSPDDRPQTPHEVAQALKPFCVRDSKRKPSHAKGAAIVAPLNLAPSASEASTALDLGQPVGEQDLQEIASPRELSSTHLQRKHGQLKNSPRATMARRTAIGFAAIAAIALAIVAASYGLRPNPDDSTALTPAGPKVKRVLMVVPFRNAFHPEVELVRNFFAQNGEIELKIASSRRGTISFDPYHRDQPGIVVDQKLSDESAKDYGAVIFTGAWDTGPNNVGDIEFAFNNQQRSIAAKFIQEMNRQQKIISSVCGGSLVLANSGILDNGRASHCEHISNHLTQSNITWADKGFVMYQNLWTARSHDELTELCNAIKICLNNPNPPDYSKYQ